MSSARPSLLLGIDGGGTKTVAALADSGGGLVGVGRAGPSNYQSVGVDAAARSIRSAVDAALRAAGVTLDVVEAAGLGVAGADREREMRIVEDLVTRAVPVEPRFVENDSLLVIRAETTHGFGVGLVAGTGTNCIGRGPGARIQIGGMGPISGDGGYALDLAMRTLAAAWRSWDGRSARSTLEKRVLALFGVVGMEGVYEAFDRGELDDAKIRELIGTLFGEAERGDPVANMLLESVSEEFADAAVAALRALGLAEEDKVVVLGGSIFQAPTHRPLSDRVRDKVAGREPGARTVVLRGPPVIGAILFARDLTGRPHDPRFAERLLGEALESPELWEHAVSSPLEPR